MGGSGSGHQRGKDWKDYSHDGSFLTKTDGRKSSNTSNGDWPDLSSEAYADDALAWRQDSESGGFGLTSAYHTGQ